MVARPVDDKPSDTLVAGPWRRVLDGEFDSPPSPPLPPMLIVPGIVAALAL